MCAAKSEGVDTSQMDDVIKLPFDEFIQHMEEHHNQVHKFFTLAHLRLLQLDPNTPFNEDNIHETYIRYFGNFFYYKHLQYFLQVRT